MRAHPAQLDAASLRYLQGVDAASGEGYPGAFVRRKPGMMTGPRGGWPVALVAGAVALVSGGLLFFPQAFDQLDIPLVVWTQVVFFTAGTFLALGGLARYRRPDEVPLVRSFVFADAHQVWDVTPTRVTALPLTVDTAVDARHLYTAGQYQQSAVTISGSGGTMTLALDGEAAVERLAAFVKAVAGILWTTGQVPVGAEAVAGRIGALADRIARYGPDADWAQLSDAPDPPRAAIDPDAVLPGRTRWASRAARGLATAAVAAAGVAFLPDVTAARHDDYLFDRIPAYDTGNLDPIDAYLDRYPDGRHAAQARDLRDDRAFAAAGRQAKADHSPAPLRQYLAETANTRHQDEARRQVAGYYDRVITTLNTRRPTDPTDRDLTAAVVALLAGLKTAPDPAVGVAFRGTVAAVPTTDAQWDREAEVYALRVSQEPRLKDLAASAPGKTAVVPPDPAFAPAQAARREGVVVDRMARAVKRSAKPDLLVIQPAAGGRPAALEVRYQVRPSGALYLHNRGWFGEPDRLAGVLRGYEVEWEVVVRPPGGGPEHVCRLPVVPLTEPRYEPGPGDPAWAAYAAVLHGAFYDLSDRLIRACGLDPGLAPSAFTFEQAAAEPELPTPSVPKAEPVGLAGRD